MGRIVQLTLLILSLLWTTTHLIAKHIEFHHLQQNYEQLQQQRNSDIAELERRVHIEQDLRTQSEKRQQELIRTSFQLQEIINDAAKDHKAWADTRTPDDIVQRMCQLVSCSQRASLSSESAK